MTFRNSCRALIAASLVLSMTLPLTAQKTADADAKFTIPETDEELPGTGPIRRYDWFRNLWQAKRSGWSQQVAADQGAVVFLGDSITQGWGDNMGGNFGDMKVANRGISGDTTRGMLIRLQEDVLALHPRAVVMLMGTNDLDEHAEPETIAANFELIIAALKKHNAEMPIIVCKVFPSSEKKNRPADKIKQVNQLYEKVVHGDPQITVLDTWTLFADEKGDAKAEEFPDLLHPNQAGYAMWAATLRPIFATLGYLETEQDDFENEPGFVSLFNGKDLTGWQFHATPPRKGKPGGISRPEVPQTITFDGKTSSDDGRYVAVNGRLVVTTPAEGRRIQQLWTTQEFAQDFVLKLEFRATPNADSGVFIRQPQLQCRDYVLAGPYTELKNYKPQDWNELVVTVKDNTAHCTCNGELLEEALKVPATGGIGLEGDRGQMEYRRIRLKELQ
ncbi:GDSL-type esterase/lipase family protein [Blastopirellula sp. J2-11]|uniref:GDSL-type esterase/lipase family protein n=1 Tax=Blastopirellula sp. J2-11 TaxID=2943192 RepID=UPI0021C82AD4|nr:GDSL-type esterase/lipase family protein [Blastopirellula sp. J2-11]UUO09192.1 GDSL-type esterase/lipase family protein [Blastopirellula sp. J2-11]